MYSNSGTWKSERKKLIKKGYEVVTVDLGLGISNEINPFEYQRDLADLRKQAGDASQYEFIVGHSEGGRLAIDYGRGHKGVITINSARKSKGSRDYQASGDIITILLNPFKVDTWTGGWSHRASDDWIDDIENVPQKTYFPIIDWVHAVARGRMQD